MSAVDDASTVGDTSAAADRPRPPRTRNDVSAVPSTGGAVPTNGALAPQADDTSQRLAATRASIAEAKARQRAEAGQPNRAAVRGEIAEWTDRNDRAGGSAQPPTQNRRSTQPAPNRRDKARELNSQYMDQQSLRPVPAARVSAPDEPSFDVTTTKRPVVVFVSSDTIPDNDFVASVGTMQTAARRGAIIAIWSPRNPSDMDAPITLYEAPELGQQREIGVAGLRKLGTVSKADLAGHVYAVESRHLSKRTTPDQISTAFEGMGPGGSSPRDVVNFTSASVWQDNHQAGGVGWQPTQLASHDIIRVAREKDAEFLVKNGIPPQKIVVVPVQKLPMLKNPAGVDPAALLASDQRELGLLFDESHTEALIDMSLNREARRGIARAETHANDLNARAAVQARELDRELLDQGWDTATIPGAVQVQAPSGDFGR